MLSITEAAAEAIRDILAAMPDAQGLRLELRDGLSTNGRGPTTVIDVVAAEEPAELDEVVEEHGVQLFVEPPLAEYLEDKLLDLDPDGDEATFRVVSRESP